MKTIANLHNLFSTLPDDIQKEIHQVSTRRKFSTGKIIYAKGDDAGDMYQIISGIVRMCTFSSDGKQFILGDFRKGDCFGDMGLIDSMPRINNTVVVRDCEVLVLPKHHFERIYYESPDMCRAINIRMARQLRLLLNMHEEMNSQPLKDRLINMIERLAYSHGEIQPEGEFSIPVSQEEIAHMLAATRQSISREIKRLEQDGMIKVGYKTLLVPDITALQSHNEDTLDVNRVVNTYNQAQIASEAED